MSSRLFKHQMAMNNRPPIKHPEFIIGYDNLPVAEIFKMTPDTSTFTPIEKPTDMVGGVIYATYSIDGKWAAFGLTVAPFVLLYRRKKNVMTPVALPDLPGVRVYDLNFGPDNVLYTTVNADPWIMAWAPDNTGEAFVKKPASYLPTASSWAPCIKPSPDGRFLAISAGGVGNNALTVFKKDASGNFTVPMVTDGFGRGYVNSIDWSDNGQRIFCSCRGEDVFSIHHLGANDVWNYQNATGRYSNLGDGMDIACNGAGNMFVIGTLFSPYFWAIYYWDGVNLTGIDKDQAPGAMYGVSISRDGKYLAGAGQNPYGNGIRGHLYKVNPNFSLTAIPGVMGNIPGYVNAAVTAFAPPSSAT